MLGGADVLLKSKHINLLSLCLLFRQSIIFMRSKLNRLLVDPWGYAIMLGYLAAWVFGILEVAAAATDFELDFSASSPLSESESLLSEESDESLETKMIILIM